MKKLICAVLIFTLLLGIAGCAGSDNGEAAVASTSGTPAQPKDSPQITPETTNNPIVFTDEAFESIVREKLGKAAGDITVAEAEAITELDLQMPGDDWSIPRISDISDLKYFPNLTSLNLSWALYKEGGVDLSPLAQLTKLEGLYIACTTIQDIEPLSALVNLKDLWLWGTRTITDISPLSELAELENIWISDNLISDISPLAGLNKLSSLTIESNMISDITPLAGLSSLKYLKLTGNPIKDYTPLSDIFPSLEEKDFELLDHSVPITFSDPILERKVREAMGVPEGDITPEMAESVTELSLGNPWQEVIPDEDKIQEISSLRYFPNLMKIELYFNNICENSSYLSVLKAMPGLKILDLNGNKLNNYYELAVCKSVEWLNLAGNFGNDLSPLSELKKLKTLYISHSPNIGDVSVLAELTSLEALFMENVAIQDYTPLSSLTNLKTLYICQGEGYNPDLSPLAGIYGNLTDKNFEMN